MVNGTANWEENHFIFRLVAIRTTAYCEHIKFGLVFFSIEYNNNLQSKNMDSIVCIGNEIILGGHKFNIWKRTRRSIFSDYVHKMEMNVDIFLNTLIVCNTIEWEVVASRFRSLTVQTCTRRPSWRAVAGLVKSIIKLVF